MVKEIYQKQVAEVHHELVSQGSQRAIELFLEGNFDAAAQFASGKD